MLLDEQNGQKKNQTIKKNNKMHMYTHARTHNTYIAHVTMKK